MQTTSNKTDINKVKILISAVIMLVILMIIYYKKISNEKKDKVNISKIENKLLDVEGRTIDKSHLKDKIIYLQFVSAFNKNDTELFDAVCENWNDDRIAKIAILEENGLITQMGNKYIAYNNTFIVIDKDEYLRKNLSLSRNINKYFIFTKNGDLSLSGDNLHGYDNGVRSNLKKILNNDSLNINNLFPINLNINKVSWLDQIVKIIKSNKGSFHLFAFMNDLCESCGSGSVVRFLKTFYKNHDFSANLIIGNPAIEYSENDISALKSQGQIRFPVIRADTNLMEKWRHFIHEYSKKELNNIILVINNNYEIILIFHPGCDCWERFVRKTKSLVKGASL